VKPAAPRENTGPAPVNRDSRHHNGTSFEDRGNERQEVRDCLGEPSGIRTLDPLIKSQVLYQLS
jgi:hypothetical protein